MPAEIYDQPLVWIDLETTGLSFETETILEVACLITDGSLSKCAQGPNLVIHHTDKQLLNMSQWCKDQHGKTGLIEESRLSTLDIEKVEEQLMKFIQETIPYNNLPLLAGSSVHFDKEFIRKYMPKLFKRLHYRIVDVTSIGEMVKRLNPTLLRRRPKKTGDHRAMGDIKDSMEELRFYKIHAFKGKST